MKPDYLAESRFEARKKIDRMLGNPYETLCNCLCFMMSLKGWENASIFWDKTLLHRNYYSKIKGNQLNSIKKENLMAICVGLELSVRMVEKVFHKAGLILKEYENPDCIYLSILENKPGLLINAGQKPLGTRERF
ncbi:MAG: hypothetical protein IJQ24_06075 [Synergistaceae bacterium]|nr:hypothetical protein [Synergistaceae bacterium]MBR0185579.1 hypothetical protein [Synergistaceae bacterium]